MTGNKTPQKTAWEEKLNRLEAEFKLLNLAQTVKDSLENNIKLLRTGIKRYDNIRHYTFITNQMASLEKKITELKTKHTAVTPIHSRAFTSIEIHGFNPLTSPTPSPIPDYLRSNPPESFSCLMFVRSKLKTPSTSIPTTTPGLRT